MKKELKSKKINRVSWNHFMNGNSCQVNLIVMLSLIINRIVILVETSFKSTEEVRFLATIFQSFFESSYIITTSLLATEHTGNSICCTLLTSTNKKPYGQNIF